MKSTIFALLLSIFASTVVAQSGPENCGCELAPVPAVLASLNGANIGELDAATLARIRALYKEVTDARAAELDLQINSKVLEMEAAKLRLSTTELLQNEVLSKVKQPTSAEIEVYFNANRAKIEAQAGRTITLGEVSEQIREFLSSEAERTAASAYADKLRAAYVVKKLVETAPVPASAADRRKVLATFGTATVTSAEVENALKPLIYNVQKELYRLRRDAVDVAINDRLLTAEATKRGITAKTLLDAEVTQKLTAITDAEAEAFFNENKARINGTFAALKPQIIAYLSEQNSNKAMSAYADSLRSGAQIKYFFSEPSPPTYDIPAVGHATKGAATARLTLTMFTDYQCPTCALANPDIERLFVEYAGKFRTVIYNFPLTMHPDAAKAAEAAEAARAQGKFWEYVDLLYKNQTKLSVVNLKEFATAAGVDRRKFDAELDSGKYRPLLEADLKKGQTLGVNGTPTFFLNGKPVNGYRYAELKAAIDAALKEP